MFPGRSFIGRLFHTFFIRRFREVCFIESMGKLEVITALGFSFFSFFDSSTRETFIHLKNAIVCGLEDYPAFAGVSLDSLKLKANYFSLIFTLFN